MLKPVKKETPVTEEKFRFMQVFVSADRCEWYSFHRHYTFVLFQAGLR